MKRQVLFWMSIMPCLLLSGCEPGIVRISEYQKSIKPYIAYWTKEGMTEEERLHDWVACGGQENGNFSWKVREQLPRESDEQSSRRQRDEHQRCMLRSGYRYTGDCSSDYMKARPLCGAP